VTSARRDVVIVPHTHWDREWYLPFQTFRLRLVELVDDLLPLLDADPGFRHFLLDGQMAVVDDYLDVRPDAEPELRRLAEAGRLAMGPWYILMDEFLVSGETIIRDLERGLARAADFGGAMTVGYLPDMFGHIAQMPQLLAQFGFEHAAVWRGVPLAMRTSAFWWEAPDGSTVRAQYLPDGYSNGSVLPDDAKELLASFARFEATYGELAGSVEPGDGGDGPLLWMNGTDHQMPRPWLSRVVAEAAALDGAYRPRVGSLEEYLAVAPTGGLDRVRGELRSGSRANLLMGVGSNRLDVHQAGAISERAIERLAEPLSALWRPAAEWPARLLDEAWLALIRNAAHDSVCACSVDEVGDAVLHRYAEARRIAEGLADQAVAAAGREVGGDLPVVVNPSARLRAGLVQVTVAGTEPLEGTQQLAVFPAERTLTGLTRDNAVNIMSATIAAAGDVVGGEVEVDADGMMTVTLRRDPARAGTAVWHDDTRRAILALAAERPDAPAQVVVQRPAGQRVLARVEVDGFGWRRMEVDALDNGGAAPVTARGSSIDNGLVRVDVDPRDGTFAVDGRSGYGRLVDDGDAGDTYNYCPPAQDETVDRPESVRVETLESGPLRARIAIHASYRWPAGLEGGARVGARVTEVTTTLEVHAGETLVRVTTALVNASRDHRLRVWLPLPEPATTSRAECAFAIVERGLEAEGGPNEPGLPTFPSRRFVQAGGLTVLHEGLLEYELVDVDAEGAHTLALTLLRCTGVISQGPMASRPMPAGPMTPVEGPQMQGPQVMAYAIALGVDPYAAVDAAFLPFLVADPAKVRGMADAPLPLADRGSRLEVTGAEVSALRRVDGRLQLRVFNPSTAASTLAVPGRRGQLVDLRGEVVGPFAGSVDLGPWRIATLLLDD
jgi:hypothetical protein